MVSLAGFVVVAQDAFTSDHKSQPIFEQVPTARKAIFAHPLEKVKISIS
jgi:hypothetical protein